MQTKKRRPQPQEQGQPKGRVLPANPPTRDDRHITIIGKDAAGKIVAQDRTDSHWKAKQIADGWRGRGLEVALIETGPASSPNSAGARSRVEPSASILGHPGASSGGGFARGAAESQ